MFRKSSNEEVAERVSEVADFIAARPFVHDGEISKFIKDRFKIQWRMAGEYIRRARRLIAMRSQVPKDKAKEIVTTFLFETMRSGARNEALKAADQLKEIYGLDAPKNLRVGDPDGQPLKNAVVAPTVIFNIPSNGREKENGK